MKKTIYWVLLLGCSVPISGQSLKDELHECVQTYRRYVNYFMAADTRNRTDLPTEFEKNFVAGAYLAHPLPQLAPQLTPRQFGIGLSRFSDNTELQLEGLRYCRSTERADVFEIYAMQMFVGDYLNPQPQQLPRFGVILSVVRCSNGVFRIADIEKMPVEFVHDPDADGDEIPDRRDKCPWLAGGLETDGAHLVKRCPQDSDGDGTFDKEDKCPNQFGEPEDKGCPNYSENEREAIRHIENVKRMGTDSLSLSKLELNWLPSAIQQLTGLKKLNLGLNRLQNVSKLRALTQLTELQLQNNRIQTFNLDLNGLPKLSKLNLDDNPIQNLPNEVLEKFGETNVMVKQKLAEAKQLYFSDNYNAAFPIFFKYRSHNIFDARMQFRIGWMYSNGKGVSKDDVEAVKWYRKAAEQGEADAQFNLGMKYDNGSGITEDDAEAVKWYRKAAEQGQVAAQNNLGVMYKYGSGVAKDDVEAVKWYRKAAEQGQIDAQNNLGSMYQNSRGGAKDEVEAVKWYRKAAEQGHAGAQNNLGIMCEQGRGVPQSKEMAINWYEKAAAQGDAAAKDNLKRLRGY